MKKYIVKDRGIEWSYDNKEKAAKKAADLNTEVTEKNRVEILRPILYKRHCKLSGNHG
jgi:hypothetical protein